MSFCPTTHKNYRLKFVTREFPYKIRHFFFLTGSGGSRAARIASSKTFFNPFCVRAEHSTYFTALNSRASFSADSTVIGFCLTFESFSIVAASSRKSICVPTSRKGVLGQWWVISGTHCREREEKEQRERERERERESKREEGIEDECVYVCIVKAQTISLVHLLHATHTNQQTTSNKILLNSPG